MSVDTIVSIIVTAAISLIPFVVGFIDEKLFGTKVFQERKIAQRRMIADMVRSQELNYVGITHGKMTDFFEDAFKEGKELHWETINLFFPTPEYGLCWDKDFNNKMCLSILEISNYLMNGHKDKLTALKQINFYLNTCGCNIGGSFFRYTNSRHRYNVIYDVMQNMGGDKEQDNAKTIRLNHRFHKQFFQRLEEMFEEIKKGAQRLYRIDLSERDLWNQSASSWEDYECENCSPHLQSMRHMINEINIGKSQNILSLGSGTGKMEMQIIENKHYKGFLGLTDKSYTMLYKAYERMKSHKNVSYALVDLARKDWRLYGALAERKYDYILMHFSLHNFISDKQTLSDLAGSLKQLLAYGGKIIVAIHDHVYGSYDENELLRSKIREFAQNHHIPLTDKNKIVLLDNLKSEFFDNGLKVIKENKKVIARSFKERVTMWKVDAILDTAIDVSELNKHKLKEALFNELDEIEEASSREMAVKYITFSEIIEVVSALIINDAGEFLTVIESGAYLLPGGEMMLGESEIETLQRKMKAELMVEPENLNIIEELGCIVFEKAFLENKPLYMHVYRCTLNQKKLTPDGKILDYAWINLDKLLTYNNMPKEYFLKILKAAGIHLQ